MWIPIPKELIIQLYCYSRQAERSVDAALWTTWAELRDYYGEEKLAAIRLLIGKLRSLSPTSAASPPSSGEEITKAVSSPSLFRVLFGGWIAAWKKVYLFTHREISFMAVTLNCLFHTLRATDRPTNEALIALRMDLHACEYLIECRCYGLPQLVRAVRIEHFNQARHLVPVKMDDLIPSTGRGNLQVEATHEHP
jgi:hypothetical protein